jgi:hypothetical protein
MANSNRNQRRNDRNSDRDWNGWNDRSNEWNDRSNDWNERSWNQNRNYEDEDNRSNFNDSGSRFNRGFNESRLNRGPSNQWGNYGNYRSTHDDRNSSSAYFGNRSYPYGNYEMENRGNREYSNPEHERFDRPTDQNYQSRNRFDFDRQQEGSNRWPMSHETFGQRSGREFEMNRGDHRGKGPRGYSRSDERIKEDINDRLSDNPFIDATEIEVTVASGEVTLTGSVTDRSDKRMAEDLAEAVSGVKNVENRIRVTTNREKEMGGSSMETERSSKPSTPEREKSRTKSNHFVES